jgi:hypothetical protein
MSNFIQRKDLLIFEIKHNSFFVTMLHRMDSNVHRPIEIVLPRGNLKKLLHGNMFSYKYCFQNLMLKTENLYLTFDVRQVENFFSK